jgi:acyl-CoA thioesterase-1
VTKRYQIIRVTPVRQLVTILVVSLVWAACSSSEPAPVSSSAQVPAALSASAAQAAESAGPAARPRIVFLGDSLTAGYGLDKAQSVPSLAQARLDAAGLDYEVVNAGVSGDTSAGGLRRLDWALDGDVRVLVVELGANDGLRGLPVDQLRRNLQQIIEMARARGIRVLLTGMEAPPNYGAAYTAEFRRVFPELARAEQVAFMPFYLEGVAGIPSLNIADGMHPNPDGARIVEANVWKVLGPMLPTAATR